MDGKWPASERWNKLRNLIMAIAQFRRPLREKRRSSMYSNSESDFDPDQISRTSTDSYLDDIVPVDKTDSSKTEFVSDLVSVESPSNEERRSTGNDNKCNGNNGTSTENDSIKRH